MENTEREEIACSRREDDLRDHVGGVGGRESNAISSRVYDSGVGKGGVGRLSRIDRAGGPDRGKVLTLVSARSYRSYLSTNLGFGINRWN